MKAITKALLAVIVIAAVGSKSAFARRAGYGEPSVCVDPANSSCVATIQDAIDMSGVAPLLITVSAGTYTENVQINLKVKGTPQSRRNITIQGAGAGATIVDGGGLDSVFNVGPRTTLTLEGLTIQNGNAKSGAGGGVSATDAKVSITSSVISGDQAILGGGVYAFRGNLDVQNSTISGNSATLGGGLFIDHPSGGEGRVATYGTGSQPESARGRGTFLTHGNLPFIGEAGRTAFISGSTISANTATLSSNQFGGSGGGVYLAGGKLIVLDSTLSGNIALHSSNSQSEGGGLANFGDSILENVTVSGNSADTGGGIYNDGHHVRLNNVTIARNSANDSGGVFSYPKLGPTLIATGPGCGHPGLHPRNFRMSNSIIADNTATDSTNDYYGWLYSDGYNLILDLDNSGCAINGDASTDIIGEDPLLQPLANNGGTTETMALGAGSPALGAGNPATPNGKGKHCEATDQVGNLRTKGECDIGALQTSGAAEAGTVPGFAR